MNILALNGGSSTIKAALFACVDNKLQRMASWNVARNSAAETLATIAADMHARYKVSTPTVVTHRVVHGGDFFSQATLLDADVMTQLQSLVALAPLHQPFNLALIDAAQQQWPGIKHVACFDTAFHQTQTDLQRRYALPRALFDRGIKHYGFHGLSYAYVSRALYAHAPTLHDKHIVIAHLGSGASACAIQKGASIATSMGFSPLDGLIMGTRCGQLDPGVILHLLREGMDVHALENLLYKQSGLLGISGSSADLRTLLNSTSLQDQEAVTLFVQRCCENIASLTATLQGIDALVFTGGIGEHQAETRARIVRNLGWLGAQLHEEKNDAHATCISTSDSRVQLFVIPTDEEQEMALQAQALI